MAGGPEATKAERFAEFLRRLDVAPAVTTFDEAFRLLGDTLNAVEDEMTSVPFDPSRWATDGRMYPPQPDAEVAAPSGRSGVRTFRTKGHRVLFGAAGAIEIQDISGRAIFSKPGADGRGA
jgi:hypothetical protein